MKKICFFVLATILSLCSCGPEKTKSDQVYDNCKSATEQYIKDMNNAKSLDEASAIRKEYREHIKFESNKLTEEEKSAYERNASWEKAKEAKQLNDRANEATKNARNRLKN